MKPKPTPKVELVVLKYRRHIRLIPHSNDAKDFVIKEASQYGNCLDVEDGSFQLEVSPGYDVSEVAEYFKSYND